MSLAAQKARVRWQCRRGMLELDLLLARFVEKYLDELAEAQLMVFDRLLMAEDPVLYAWLMGHEKPLDQELLTFVDFIRLHNSIH